MPTDGDTAQQPQPALYESSAQSKGVGLDVRELLEYSISKDVYYKPAKDKDRYDIDSYCQPSPRYTWTDWEYSPHSTVAMIKTATTTEWQGRPLAPSDVQVFIKCNPVYAQIYVDYFDNLV